MRLRCITQFNFFLSLFIAVGMLLASHGAWACDEETFGTMGWGFTGYYRVLTPQCRAVGTLAVTLTGDYAHASSFLVSGDTTQILDQALNISLAPWDGLEVSLGEGFTTVTNNRFPNSAAQVFGNPALRAKYVYEFDYFSLGGAVQMLVPSSAHSAALNFTASTFTLLAIGSYVPIPHLTLAANVGAIIDNSANLYNEPLNQAQLLASNIITSSRATLTLAASWDFDKLFPVPVMPFLELGGDIIAPGSSFSERPLRASLGAKVLAVPAHGVEFHVGSDVRLTGAPTVGSPYVGIPPWQVFAQVVLHVGATGQPIHAEDQAARPVRVLEPPTCKTKSDCADDAGCLDGHCWPLKEPTAEVLAQALAAANKETTFTLAGTVTDAKTHQPLPRVALTFSDFKDSVLMTTDAGTFTSFPLPCGPGVLKVTASATGYRDQQEVIPKGKPGEVKQLALTMVPSTGKQTGVLSGNVKDAATGADIVHAEVFLPELHVKLVTDEHGVFTAELPVGRHRVLISANGYITQKHSALIQPSETLILNVDLQAVK